MKYIIDHENKIIGTGDGTAPLAGGLRYVDSTPELDAQYAVLAASVPPPSPETDPRIIGLRAAYRQATQGLCQLAGHAPADKLEDAEFATIRAAAFAADLATAVACCDTLVYCLFQLYRLDGADAWERI
jgi:hypothetical protein